MVNISIKKLGLSCIIAGLLFGPTQVGASEDDAVSRHVLLGLAKNFVSSVGETYKDIEKKSSHNDINKLSEIPDGEMLLLRMLADKLLFDFSLYATKHNGEIYLSFLDVIEYLDLAIEYDEETKTGKGWFIKEDWEIDFDFNAGIVNSRGKTYKIINDAVVEIEGEVFINRISLAEWTGIKFDPDTAQQYVTVSSEFPLPAVARYKRRKKSDGGIIGDNEAKFPRAAEEYDWLDINTARVSARSNVSKSQIGVINRRSDANVSVGGELLKHELYALSSYNNVDGVNSVVSRLSKNSEKADLLGPLNARFYEIGDINTVSLPLASSQIRAVGARITNKILYDDNFQKTVVQGDAIPGWDVELYRNGSFIASHIVGDDGSYKFKDVHLFIGDNKFELYFYGPQGEMRTEEIEFPVTRDLISKNKDTYDISVVFKDTRTYRKTRSTDEDAKHMNISAKYNKYYKDTLMYAGFSSDQIDGEKKTYGALGFSKLWNNNLIDGNFAFDEEFNKSLKLTGRKNIDKWQLSLSTEMQDDDYKTEGASSSPFGISANANKNFPNPIIGKNANVGFHANYNELNNGGDIKSYGLDLSSQILGVGLSNNLSYTETSFASGDGIEDLNNRLSIRGRYKDFFMNSGLFYTLKPERQLKNYNSQLSYRSRDNDISADLFLNRFHESKVSDARLSFNYNHEKFRISPFIKMNNLGERNAGISLNFEVIDDPSGDMPAIIRDRAFGKGAVSVFVYHDQNGNRMFDEGDVPLDEVDVEALTYNKKASTNKEGYALITDLPIRRATDIHVREFTLPDPFMIQAGGGLSVVPRPDEIMQMEFPVHMSGEIDGTVYWANKNGDIKYFKNSRLHLYNREGIIIQSSVAAYDGFYVFSQIPPGQYYLVIDKYDAEEKGLARPLPREIIVGYGGTIHYGVDLVLSEDLNVDYDLTPDIDAYKKLNAHVVFPDMDEQRAILNLGEFNSSLKMALTWHKIQTRYSMILRGARPMVKASQSVVQGDKRHVLRVIVENVELPEMMDKCRALRARDISCKMEFLPMEVKIADSKI